MSTEFQLIGGRERIIELHKEISQDRESEQGGQHDGADPVLVRPGVLPPDHIRAGDIYPQGVAAEEDRHWHHDQTIHHRPLICLGKSMNKDTLACVGGGAVAGDLRDNSDRNGGKGDGHVKPRQERPLVCKEHLGLNLDGDLSLLVVGARLSPAEHLRYGGAHAVQQGGVAYSHTRS